MLLPIEMNRIVHLVLIVFAAESIIIIDNVITQLRKN